MPLDAATRIGPYEILGTLGSGAMGDVYRARDSRLNREVALKIIAPESAQDTIRLQRFEQEARAASALNHPNILVVYDLGEEGGYSYLVSELVEGENLRKLIERGPVPIKRLLDIATQIADALAAAHQAGIVHRDLKPENIMLTKEGRVKLLDFGLAKPMPLLSSSLVEDRTVDGSHTQPGLILGTVGYMSPEQATGSPVSFQTDQFALGVMLHEMATGTQPFRRDTPLQTLHAILNDEPPFTPGPAPFRWLVEQCLAKDAAQRYSSTVEVHNQLRKIRDSLVQTPSSSGMSVVAERRSWRVPALLAAGALLLAMGVGYVVSQIASHWPIPQAALQYQPFVTSAGVEAQPVWSPDGKTLAYAGEQEGRMQIFTRSIGSYAHTQVTQGDADHIEPFWSADGTRLYSIQVRGAARSLWSVSVAGGAPRREQDDVYGATLSPNGKTLALLRPSGPNATAYQLWVATPPASPPTLYRTGEWVSPLLLPETYMRFTPDSDALGIWATLANGQRQFWLLPTDGGTPRRMLAELADSMPAQPFTWLRGSRSLLYSGKAMGAPRQHLWQVDLSSGKQEPVTSGTGNEQEPVVSRDGTRVAFLSSDARAEVVSLPLPGGTVQNRLSEATDSPSPVWSPVADEFAYVSYQGSSPEIRLRRLPGGWERAIATQSDFGESRTVQLRSLTYSPDGQRIAYQRTGTDGEAIWISTVSNQPPQRLLLGNNSVQRYPTWSPDGAWIAYQTIQQDGHVAVMRVRVGSGEKPSLVQMGKLIRPVWSPAGQWLVGQGTSGGLHLVLSNGQQSRQLSSDPWLSYTWAKDGQSVIGIRVNAQRQAELVMQPVQKKSSARVLSVLGIVSPSLLPGSPTLEQYSPLSLNAAGNAVMTARSNLRSDIWLLSGLPTNTGLFRWLPF